jgi:hypothetical protein
MERINNNKETVMVLKVNLEKVSKVTLKQRFLYAVYMGELGSVDDQGTVVTLRQFKAYFKDIKTRYRTSFLPAAAIEVGQHTMTHTKFVFRISKGVYRVHPDAVNAFLSLYGLEDEGSEEVERCVV